LGGPDRAEESAEWRKLEATWKIVILDSDGVRFEGGFSSFDRVVIEKRELIAKGSDRTQDWGTLTIDPSTSPKLMDPKEKGYTGEGIYQVEGDRLQICLGRNTGVKERPTQFPEEAQKGVLYLVLEREKR
jgi:uncharacterized protein (TIGR03067 family)